MTIQTDVKRTRWVMAGVMTIAAVVATANQAQARKGMSLFLTNSLPSTCDVKTWMVGYQSGGGSGVLCEVWATTGATAFTPCPPAVNQFDLNMSTDWHNPIATMFRVATSVFPGAAQVSYGGTLPTIPGCSGVSATATGTANN
jgi:hypothetical protein